jgi:hypothetical protein
MKKIGTKIAAMVTILFFLQACSTSLIYVAPDEKDKISRAESVLVRTADGTEIEFQSPRIEKGKIVGVINDGREQGIEFSSIQAVVIKKANSFYAYLYGAAGAVLAWLAIGSVTAPSPPPESCPFIYSFDGRQFVFEAEPYGGAICRGLKRSEWIGLDHLRDMNGFYKIQIANVLEETEYTDELKILVVDHSPNVKAVPDGIGRLHAISTPLAPSRAYDKSGREVAELVSTNDGRFWESRMDAVNPTKSEDLRDELTLEFPKPAGAHKVKLIANAWTTLWGSQVAKRFLELYGRAVHDWTHQVDALGPEYLWVMNWYAREELYLLGIQVETDSGWKPRGMIYGGGPFVAKDKACEFDISDVSGDTLKIKLRPPALFWKIDSLAVDYSDDPPLAVTELAPLTAADRAGRDVRELLTANDGRFLIMPNAGDSADVVFQAPPLAPGRARTLILKTTGYYDIHLEAKGEPNIDIIERVHREPGFTLQFAYQEYLKKMERLE